MKKNLSNLLAFILFITILTSLFQIVNQPTTQNSITGKDPINVEKEAERIYGGYINLVANQIESKIDSIFNELAILRDINQSYIDNGVLLEPVTDAMKGNPYTTDKLTYNGKWYQNTPDEPNVVMVHRHLLENNGEIKEEVRFDLDNTLILDFVLPSFQRNGVNKQLAYAQGGLNKSFTRMSPWVDLGTLFYEVYPAFIDTNIWEAFNPGLVAAFEKRMQEEPGVKEDPNKLARVLLPVQDGVTGEIVMTFTSPVFDPDREKFRGTVAFDVTMKDLTDLVEGIHLFENSFSFLSQSSGNVFAINDEGAKQLGFEEALDSLEVTGKGVGFNKLERMLDKSIYDDVKSLKLPLDNEATYKQVNLNGINYVVVMQKLKPFQIWIANDWFKNESWVVGLLIPESELIQEALINSSEENVKGNTNMIQIYLMGISAFGLLLISLFNTNKPNSAKKD